MKRAVHGGSFIFEDGKLIGISTGFEHAAEHECGMRPLQSAAGIVTIDKVKPKKRWFGLKTIDPDFGLDRTTIKNPDLILQGIAETKDGNTYYVFGYNVVRKMTTFSFVKDFDAYWDEHGFLIASTDKENMMQIVKAAYDGDLAFATGGKVLPDHAGIRMVIKSRVSKELKEQCERDDISYYELRRLHHKIGIHLKLKKANCEFYACSPKWKDEEKKEIWWWLNPCDQNNIESGYYTYDELIQWTKGTGPVYKKNKDEKENGELAF